MDKAFKLGVEARVNGETINSNPFKEQEQGSWDSGWHSLDEEIILLNLAAVVEEVISNAWIYEGKVAIPKELFFILQKASEDAKKFTS